MSCGNKIDEEIDSGVKSYEIKTKFCLACQEGESGGFQMYARLIKDGE
jgi:hypothetical protein